MKITQLRNATVLLEFASSGQPVALLVDPMLAPQGSLPTLKYLGGRRRRNPLVELPEGSDALLQRATHGLITHCQRGHFDHLDRAGKRFLRERGLPVLCMPRDEAYLKERGLRALAFDGAQRQPFFGGHITPIPCIHGHGLVGKLMEHGHGYFIELPGEPSVYLAGDTLLTDTVRDTLSRLRPDLAVLPAGGARFDLGGDILMTEDEVCQAAQLFDGRVLANHLEALDHCPGTRASLLQKAARLGLGERLLAPWDGQALAFSDS